MFKVDPTQAALFMARDQFQILIYLGHRARLNNEMFYLLFTKLLYRQLKKCIQISKWPLNCNPGQLSLILQRVGLPGDLGLLDRLPRHLLRRPPLLPERGLAVPQLPRQETHRIRLAKVAFSSSLFYAKTTVRYHNY